MINSKFTIAGNHMFRTRFVAFSVNHAQVAGWLNGITGDGHVFMACKPPYDGLFIPWAADAAGYRDAYRMFLKHEEYRYAVFAVALGHSTLLNWMGSLERRIGKQRIKVKAYGSSRYKDEIRFVIGKV